MPTAEEWGIVFLTIRIAALATILLLPIGVAAGVVLARYRGPGKSVAETVLSLPLVLPPTAVGILLLRALSRQSAVGGWLAVRGIEVVVTAS